MVTIQEQNIVTANPTSGGHSTAFGLAMTVFDINTLNRVFFVATIG